MLCKSGRKFDEVMNHLRTTEIPANASTYKNLSIRLIEHEIEVVSQNIRAQLPVSYDSGQAANMIDHDWGFLDSSGRTTFDQETYQPIWNQSYVYGDGIDMGVNGDHFIME